jgi:hypothetical protein
MKMEVVVEAVLVSALAVYGIHLGREARALNSNADQLKGLSMANGNIMIRSVSGIDAVGAMVNKVITPGTERFVVFALRGRALDRDLHFWGSAASLLSKDSRVRLLAFCDSRACAQAVRLSYQSLSFPVIAYGEAKTSQAVLSADERGELVLLGGALQTIGKFRWRGEDVTPADVTREVLP